ncbi:beta-galactosidase [Paenibacillus sp. TRM 82003]|uniref:beta-galactosidase n=1 Tax=Kineococcus sp. TRM81007 TaxID=2925831 RepID=UPI001F564A85|nr:beta-galactosidase [Kineococcus sp. TRM81007]MCI2237759.1 beta-galactosidase [Kineococcus sp. TRM81007]MCI3921777.1 beta-galactosidase [Paenibacillus sp. TRM 82003]
MNETRYQREVLVGAAYYHEYHRAEQRDAGRLKTDMDLMAAAGFSVVRVGESVWSTWEPREGEFDLDWLEPVLDAAHERGISAVVGTPTYAVPPWLRRTYPETALDVATGVTMPYGRRQDVDHSHPTFRHLAERLVRAVVTRYADHPAVIGWQVDNEPGIHLLHNHGVFQRFVEHLKSEYGTVEELNERWGLTYWSHRLSDWADLWVPEGNTTPSYQLAWRRFQAQLTHEHIAWQAGIVRSLVPEHQFVTTCVALNQDGLDVGEVGRPLDVVGTNVYYGTQDDLELPGSDDPAGTTTPFWVPWAGTAYLHLQADLSRGTAQAPFLVTETNATSIGGPAENHPSYDGQWRQVIWTLVARGARMVEYWHWHSLPYGAETDWGGVLGHSLQPGRAYDEIAATAHELAGVTADLHGLTPRSDVGLLLSAESKWAMQFFGPLHAPGTWLGDTASYDRILAAFYRGLFDAGLSVDVVPTGHLPHDPEELLRRWPVLVVPGLHVASDELLDLLRRYVVAGGHLVLSPRCGVADTDAVVRQLVAPGVLREAVGARQLEHSNTRTAVPVTGLPGAGTGWIDGLLPEGAEVLAGYDHPHFGRFAAVTTNTHGEGRATWVGTVPDRDLGRAVGRFVARTSVPDDPWRHARTETTTVVTADTDTGALRFVHHWAWGSTRFTVPEDCTDVLDGTELPAGSTLDLGPWDVRVLRVPTTPTTPNTTPTTTTGQGGPA